MAVSKIPFNAPSYIRSITLYDDINFDNVTTPGFYQHNYYEGASHVITNGPTNLANLFAFMVLDKSGGKVQVVIDNESQMFFRVKWSTEWKPWRKVTTTTLS